MTFAISEINANQSFLPNTTLGFKIYDTCLSSRRALQGTLWMLGGQPMPILNYRCQHKSPLLAVIGESRSTSSISMARVLGLNKLPQVSYFSTSPLLSNKIQFPSFFRTIPNDNAQTQGLTQLVLHFGWTWVGVISTDDDYGEMGSQILKKDLQKLGICIAFHETFPTVSPALKIQRIIGLVQKSSAKVILVFASDPFVVPLMEEISRQNITDKVLIATEAWSTSSRVFIKEFAHVMEGTIGLVTPEGSIPGFKEFFLSIRPTTSSGDVFAREFWESVIGCQWLNQEENQTITNEGRGTTKVPCTGEEILQNDSIQKSESALRISYNMYNAVYAVAHALQDMHSCIPGLGPFNKETCADMRSIRPWQLLHYMKKVHFKNKVGEEIAFDSQGDPPARYDIIHWKVASDGTMQYVKVGRFDDREAEGLALRINLSVTQWNARYKEVPRSVCSESCPPGYHKAAQKGQPACCFDCVPCAEGEISNETDSSACWKCPSDQWSNEKRNECVPKEIEYLSYEEPLGATLTGAANLGSFSSIIILCIFVKYRHTPVVKANNRNLTYLLLGALLICFLCSLLFIGLPHPVTCLLRQSAFGIMFILCVSCVLAKTIMVVIAFNATKPGSNMRKWLGPKVPAFTISGCTLGQVLICTAWLLLCPPFPEKNMESKTDTIIFQCNECSVAAFWCMLGYMGLLAGVSFLVAFLSRRLPDSFNEAKWITFSMLVFISVWGSFVPGHLSTQGKYTVAVEVYAILSSSSGVLACIFFPKCYIILLKPERNTRENLLGKGTKTRKR
ncbi:extracellular calcium-sensing receptor-like [Pleurodeles waltl]|uniref:extracellular calcium-sensing receptor-like n=1 Tax=Pleurodeles waltl TaxID=8319 RepID=UPI003709A581